MLYYYIVVDKFYLFFFFFVLKEFTLGVSSSFRQRMPLTCHPVIFIPKKEFFFRFQPTNRLVIT